MSLSGKAKFGLTAVFAMVALDLAVAGGTGLLGWHGAMVDFGAAAGESLGIPYFDWGGFVSGEGFGFIDPDIAGLHLGHIH